jgi:hypothetical protein
MLVAAAPATLDAIIEGAGPKNLSDRNSIPFHQRENIPDTNGDGNDDTEGIGAPGKSGEGGLEEEGCRSCEQSGNDGISSSDDQAFEHQQNASKQNATPFGGSQQLFG